MMTLAIEIPRVAERIAKIEGVVEQMSARLNHIESQIAGLRLEIAGFREELRSEIAGLRDEFREEIGALEQRISARFRDQTTWIQIMFSTLAAMMIAILVKLFLG